MSIHRSLRASRGTAGHRNVLTRLERIQKLEVEGRWSETTQSVFGLPKVRSIKPAVKKKKKEKTAEGAAAAPAAAPAAK